MQESTNHRAARTHPGNRAPEHTDNHRCRTADLDGHHHAPHRPADTDTVPGHADGHHADGRHADRRTPPSLTAAATVTRTVLTAAMLSLTGAISVGAGWLSFLAIRDLAVLAGWPADTAWAVQPIIELFLVVGSLEIVCRAWEGRTDLTYPKALIGAALAVVLAANVTDHVLRARLTDRRPAADLILVGVLAALVPAAQLGSLHLMSGRLRSLGGRTTVPDADIAGTAARTAAPTSPPDIRTDTTDMSASRSAGRRRQPRTSRADIDRTRVVSAVLSGQMTAGQAAAHAGRDVRTIRRWVADHRTHPGSATGQSHAARLAGQQPGG
jgi:hypothetical protein